MKRNSDIAFFQKHEAKKAVMATAATSNHSPDPVELVVEEQTLERVIEETVNPMPPPSPQPSSLPPVYDINRLPHDPGETQPILSYLVNDQDVIQRAYIIKGLFKPFAHHFPKRKISYRDPKFNCFFDVQSRLD
jgi:hypothetical protein